MDGDVAPLPSIIEVCNKHGAMLMIDEAHATGVLGATGRGTEEHFGLLESEAADRSTIVMGTLSKAVGSFGGFVAGSRELVDYLKNTARSFIYTTALPPSVCAASLAGIRLIEVDSQSREKLQSNIRLLSHLLSDLLPGAQQSGSNSSPVTPIFPIHVGDAARAVAVSQRLFEAGYLCPAIRPPTVPAGTSRLRVSVQAGHTQQQLRGFVETLAAEIGD